VDPLRPETWTPADLPRQLGRYQLMGILGQGGSAQVFDARLIGPEGLDRPVALKVLRSDATSPKARQMLLREARLGSLVRHPNVVDVFDLGEAEGLPYVAMERIVGVTLSELLAEDSLPPATALDLLQQLASGLAALHDLSQVDGGPACVVHRDLKPGNVLVDPTGRVRVVDFGIAVVGDPDRPTDAWGTKAYMSPEQATGEPVTPASDVFGFGALIFEVLTGRKLWPQPTLRQLVAALHRVEQRLDEGSVLAEVDLCLPGAGEVLQACLRYEPAQRVPHAAALWDALDALNSTKLGPSDLAERARRVHRASGKHPVRRSCEGGARPRLVGRTDELAALTASDARLRTLVGPLGAGKSALARVLLHQEGPRRSPDTRAVSLRSCATPAAALQRVARDLGIATAFGSIAGGVWTIGETLAARGPLLWLLDDADGCAEALRGWIPSWLMQAPDLRAVVTARHGLEVAGEELHAVGPLAEEAALELLALRLPEPRSMADRRRMLRRTGRLPLALELAAASGTADRARTTTGLTSGPLPHLVRSSLRGAWRGLPLTARQALAACSVFEDGQTLADAVAIMGAAGLEDPGESLELLERRGLLRRARGRSHPRLVLDEPLHGFAAEQLARDPELQDRLTGAHADRYAELGTDAALRALAGPRAIEQQDRWVDELANLQVALRRSLDACRPTVAARLGRALHEAAVLGQVAPDLAALTQRLRQARDMPPRERLRLDLSRGRALVLDPKRRSGQDILRTVVRRARGTHEPRVLAQALLQLARTDLAAGRYEQSWQQVEEAQQLGRALSARALVARSLRTQASLLRRRGEHGEAIQALERARRLCRALAHAHLQTEVDALQALVHMALGELGLAQGLLQGAVAVLRTSPDQQGLARQLGNLGLVKARAGQLDPARRDLQEGMDLYHRVGALADAAYLHQTLGSIALDQGDLDEALAQHEKAVAIARKVGARDMEGLALNDASLSRRHRGDLAGARRALVQAKALLTELGQPLNVAVVEINLSELDCVEGRLSEARARLEDVLARPEVRDNERVLACARGMLGESARLSGDLETAHQELDAALAVLETSDHQAWCEFAVRRARLDLDLGDLAGAEGRVEELGLLARKQGMGRRAPLRSAVEHLARELERARR